jgi:hypothetical protein
MGGIDTKGRYHIHWGAPETYGERREESALRRSGRPVPDQAYAHFDPIHPEGLEAILERFDFDPKRMLEILEATQAEYGHLPVAALKLISQRTGAWYAMIYGTASYYRHLRFEPPAAEPLADRTAVARAGREVSYLAGLDASLAGTTGAGAAPTARAAPGAGPARA